MMQAHHVRNPRSVDEIDTAWFREMARARVLEVKKGTATKIRCELTHVAGGSEVVQTVWVKTGFEDHSHTIGTDLVYAGEVFYYQNVIDLDTIEAVHGHA